MSYKQANLWKTAFEIRRDDATSEEQARLASCYDAMRSRAGALVAKIARDLPFMTIHDVTHLDALWDMASIAAGQHFELNPAEAFIFGGALLLHDAAMTLAAFPNGVAELRASSEWRDLYSRYATFISMEDVASLKGAEDKATADALRLLHAKQSENLALASWLGPDKNKMFLIEDQQIRNFYGSKIGKIAYSHWWSIAKVEEELSGVLGALPGVTTCTVDLLKVACLLRVADAMHLDQRRATAFEFALVQPTGVAADHWKFQERMASPFIQGDALIYTAQPPFEIDQADAWWTAYDALQMVDSELRNVDRVLRDRQKSPLAVRRVEGAQSPSDLARTVETDGWTPVDSTVRVSDVPKIVATLGGSKLYGKSQLAPLRELIQNGLDAITARRRLQGRAPKWGELIISLKMQEGDHWISVEDNGVGMSEAVLTGPLIDFGNSFWRSSLAIQEFPGLSAAGMKARGKYGIGFFSTFMLGDIVKVVTRRYDRESSSAKVLEFRHGLQSRPNMRHASSMEAPMDGGTRIEIKLKDDPYKSGGLLSRSDMFGRKSPVKFGHLIAQLAPACDVAINVIEEGESAISIGAADWLEIESSALLSRIVTGDDSAIISSGSLSGEALTFLRDEDGKLFGRARIEVAEYWNPSGLVVVDGLAASRIGLIAGILTGVETTASRNSAQPLVPGPVLAAWSSEQASKIAGAELPDIEKAQSAAIVLACNGDIGGLPIVWWRGRWMNSNEFENEIRSLDELAIYEGTVAHEEDDDVTRREFENSFRNDEEIAETVGSHKTMLPTDWINEVTKGAGQSPKEVLEEILASVWGEVEIDEESRAVGTCNGTEILRNVDVYCRAPMRSGPASV